MTKKVRWLKGRKKSAEQELQEILSRPPKDPEHKQMRAWLKREKLLFGRGDYSSPYRDWLEDQFGPIENAEDEWLHH
jgi:hypothetical protein